MSDLVTFLTARLDEDEARATAMRESIWPQEIRVVPSMDSGRPEEGEPMGAVTVGPQYSPKAYVTLWNPAQVDCYEDRVEDKWRWHESAVEVWGARTAERLLADVAAKRVALDWYLNDDDTVMRATILALAAVYADHPDFDPAWRT